MIGSTVTNLIELKMRPLCKQGMEGSMDYRHRQAIRGCRGWQAGAIRGPTVGPEQGGVLKLCCSHTRD